eukprot:gene32615-17632_t
MQGASLNLEVAQMGTLPLMEEPTHLNLHNLNSPSSLSSMAITPPMNQVNYNHPAFNLDLHVMDQLGMGSYRCPTPTRMGTAPQSAQDMQCHDLLSARTDAGSMQQQVADPASHMLPDLIKSLQKDASMLSQAYAQNLPPFDSPMPRLGFPDPKPMPTMPLNIFGGLSHSLRMNHSQGTGVSIFPERHPLASMQTMQQLNLMNSSIPYCGSSMDNTNLGSSMGNTNLGGTSLRSAVSTMNTGVAAISSGFPSISPGLPNIHTSMPSMASGNLFSWYGHPMPPTLGATGQAALLPNPTLALVEHPLDISNSLVLGLGGTPLPQRFNKLPLSVQARIVQLISKNPVVKVKDFDIKVVRKLSLLVTNSGEESCLVVLNFISTKLDSKQHHDMKNAAGYLDVAIGSYLDTLRTKLDPKQLNDIKKAAGYLDVAIGGYLDTLRTAAKSSNSAASSSPTVRLGLGRAVNAPSQTILSMPGFETSHRYMV